MEWFAVAQVDEKIRRLPEALTCALAWTEGRREAISLARDVRVVNPAELPPKQGLSSAEGQARLLHDLASIELQAMELAVRSLFDYPDAPREFREGLAELAAGEGRHLALCLEGLRKLGYEWGDWDVHLSLWNTVGPEDDLLDRILIVHRYLEGSGLDAGESILRRLSGTGKPWVKSIVDLIVREEVDHVRFGSRWYRAIAESRKLDADREFTARIGRIARLAPRREKIARSLRTAAGFNGTEIDALESAQREEVGRGRNINGT